MIIGIFIGPLVGIIAYIFFKKRIAPLITPPLLALCSFRERRPLAFYAVFTGIAVVMCAFSFFALLTVGMGYSGKSGQTLWLLGNLFFIPFALFFFLLLSANYCIRQQNRCYPSVALLVAVVFPPLVWFYVCVMVASSMR